MTEVTNLKMEARRLLDEVNNYFERSPNGARILSSTYDYGNIYEDSFKDRLHRLKQKIHELSSQNTRVK